MKALILAGGRATRLRPITHTINKHLIPLANKPMIFYAIEKVMEAGIKDVIINVNPNDTEIRKFLKDGSQWGINIDYVYQIGGALGIAHAVKMAEEKLLKDGPQPFVLYLGDNIVLGSLKKFIDKFKNENLNCMLALAKVRDPQRFGVPELVDGRIVRVEEKPVIPKSEYAVSGIYIYDHHFFDIYSHIKPSDRGEYEISDVHTQFIERGFKVGYEEITGWWKDTGKPEDLLEGNSLILTQIFLNSENKIEGEVHLNALIQGKVHIGKGSVVGEKVVIRGPVVIGENCKIENSYIGPYTSIGNNVSIANTEIEHSIVLDNVNINCDRRIVDSIIGANAKVCSVNGSLPKGHKLIIGDNTVIEL